MAVSAFNLGNVEHMFTKVQLVSYNGEVFHLNLSFHNNGDSNLEDDDLIQNFLFPTQESKIGSLVVDFFLTTKETVFNKKLIS